VLGSQPHGEGDSVKGRAEDVRSMNLTRKYSDEQRDAVAAAANTPGLTARRVRALAGAGELRTSEGRGLEPFEIPENSIRHYARKARLRPTAEPADAATPTSGDEVRALRRRLLKVANAEMSKLERRSKADAHITGEEIRQMARALAEIHRLQIPEQRTEPTRSEAEAAPVALGERILSEIPAEPTAPPAPTPPPVAEDEPAGKPALPYDSAKAVRELREKLEAALPKPKPEPAPLPRYRTLQSGPRQDGDETPDGLYAEAADPSLRRSDGHTGRMRGFSAPFPR
jgi:hypothetical protein